MDLAGFAVVSPLPRRRMDARTLSELRTPHGGLRWLPLPGFSPSRRRHGNGPCLLAGSSASSRGNGSARSQLRCASSASRPSLIIRALAEVDCRFLELSYESRVGPSMQNSECGSQNADCRLRIDLGRPNLQVVAEFELCRPFSGRSSRWPAFSPAGRGISRETSLAGRSLAPPEKRLRSG